MLNKLKSRYFEIIAFALGLFVTVFALTLDTYMTDWVTPEIFFLHVFGAPFYRVEFLAVIFSFLLAVGAGVALLLKDKCIKLLPISVALLGIIALFAAFFDVDLMQSLDPTLRISHVSMSVSRIVTIVISASGAFVGILTVCLVKSGRHLKLPCAAGIIAGLVFAMYAVGDATYNLLYYAVGLIIILIAIACSYLKIPSAETITDMSFNGKIDKVRTAFSAAALTTGGVVLSYYMLGTLSFSVNAYCVTLALCGAGYAAAHKLQPKFVCKIVLTAAALILTLLAGFIANGVLCSVALIILSVALGANAEGSADKITALIACITVFISAVIGYLLVHNLSTEIVHSGVRIYLYPQSYVWLVVAALAVPAFVLGFMRKNQPAIQAE